MCNCTGETLAVIKEKILNLLPENIQEGSFSIDWEHKVFRLDGKGNNVVMPVAYEYRSVKKDGTPYRNASRSTVSIHMTYCPFCGEKF